MKFENGCYVGAYFSNEEEYDKLVAPILDIVRTYLKKKVELDFYPDEPHVTLMYSYDIPSKEIKVKDFTNTNVVGVKALSFEVFPYIDKSSLVLLVDSFEFYSMHEKIKELYSVSPTYPDYKPHITLATFDSKHADYVKGILKELDKEIKNSAVSTVAYVKETVEYKIEDLDPK